MMTNLATNQHDTRMVVNRGLTASKDESSGLNLRGGGDESALLDGVDSKQMIKNLMASQKYFPMDYFVTYTCNMKKQFGTKPIKDWIDDNKWQENYPNYDTLNNSEKLEIKSALDQAAAPLLLRAWNESCRIFLDYLKKSPFSPFKNIETIFARHEFQSSIGNLPHIHAMLKLMWNAMSQEQRDHVNELIRASYLDIVRVDERPRLIEEGRCQHDLDVKEIIELAKSIVVHRCSLKCMIRVGENKFVYRKLNYLKMNPHPGNTRETYIDLPNEMSLESLHILEKVKLLNLLNTTLSKIT